MPSSSSDDASCFIDKPLRTTHKTTRANGPATKGKACRHFRIRSILQAWRLLSLS